MGVLPAASRNTPTPTSILSGRGSASHKAIKASSESLWTGGRSASRAVLCELWALASVVVSMASRIAKLRVVIHRDAIAQRHRLAGQHITIGDFLVGQTVARSHFDLAAGHLG